MLIGHPQCQSGCNWPVWQIWVSDHWRVSHLFITDFLSYITILFPHNILFLQISWNQCWFLVHFVLHQGQWFSQRKFSKITCCCYLGRKTLIWLLAASMRNVIKSPLSTQTCIPLGSLNWVPEFAGVKPWRWECHLRWVAGNAVWSHMACEFPWWWGNEAIGKVGKLLFSIHLTLPVCLSNCFHINCRIVWPLTLIFFCVWAMTIACWGLKMEVMG